MPSPFCLIGRCLQKICLEECTITLVVPWWHSQAWFPTLIKNLVEPPLLLPRRRDLLKDPLNQFHPLVEQGHLQLVACRVSGSSMQQQEFQRKLQTSCWQVGARGQTPLTSLDGQSGAFGVVNGNWIPFHAESNHFLADLYEQGLQYHTINTIRSAVSMTHNTIGNTPIGQHPQLMKGIYNSRPPEP